MTIFKPLTNTGRYMPNSWIRPEEPILSTHDARCDFTPMLTVSIKDGVLFDRRREVMYREMRGAVYEGRWVE